MKLDDSRWVFYITSLLKQSRKGRHMAPIELLTHPSNTKLCIVTVLREYLHRTKDIREGQRQLLLSHQKPHHPISNDTLARWVRDTLQRAGVDTLLFSAHSTKSACTSAAACRGLPIDVITKAAGWSAASTFTRFYKNTLVLNLGQTMLGAYWQK